MFLYKIMRYLLDDEGSNFQRAICAEQARFTTFATSLAEENRLEK